MNADFQNTKYEIRNTKYAAAFSLMEVLLAVGTLAIGMLFIAGVFPVSIHFTTVAAERTIAVAVADEAFAKIKLYDINPASLPVNAQVVLENVPLKNGGFLRDANEFGYPSIPTTEPYSKRYWWSAICRRVGPADVQVTVFISRKTGVATAYFNSIDTFRPVAYRVLATLAGNDLQISNLSDRPYINDGYTIVDDTSGRIYRVLERYGNNFNLLRLNEIWQGNAIAVWVIPPPVTATGVPTGGRYPCIAVYQKVMRF